MAYAEDPYQDDEFQRQYTPPQQNQPGVIPPPEQQRPKPTGSADSNWLNWIDKTYGTSKSRGGGFADLPGGVGLEDVVKRFNNDTGWDAKFEAGPSGDRVNFGEGAKDVLTSEGQLWYNYGPGGPPGGGGQPQVNNTNQWQIAAPSQPAQQQQSATGSAARTALLQLLKESSGKPDVQNDPILQAQMTAFRNETDRARQGRRAADAERLAYTGGQGSAELDQRTAQGFEDAGRSNAAFGANLAGGELMARRELLMKAVAMGLGDENTEESMNMQRELAGIDAQLRREGYDLQRHGMDQSNNQFNSQLGYNYSRDNADRENQMLQFLMGQ